MLKNRNRVLGLSALALGAIACAGFNADINGDGRIDSADLALLLGSWNGQVPPAVTLQVLPQHPTTPLRLHALYVGSATVGSQANITRNSEITLDPQTIQSVGVGAQIFGGSIFAEGTLLFLQGPMIVVVSEPYDQVVQLVAQARGWDLSPQP